jgi:hypothetical protein
MFPEPRRVYPSVIRAQQGSMLVVAVFIIVVFGALIAALSNILTSSQTAVGYEVLGVRAQAVANAGMEAGLYQVLRQAATCSVMSGGATTPQTELTATLDTTAPALTQCTVSVKCGQRSAVAGSTATYYVLNSTGTCIGGNQNLTAQRTIKAEVQR